MPATERYQTDVFAIIVVIASVLVLVFLIVAAIYFNGLQNWTAIPGNGESTFLFWTAIVLGVIFLAIIIYGLYRIFTHRAVICPPLVTRVRAEPTTTISRAKPIPVANPPSTQVVQRPTTPAPASIPVSNLPTGPYPSEVRTAPTSLASYPSSVRITTTPSPSARAAAPTATSSAQSSLQSELLNLSSAMDQ